MRYIQAICYYIREWLKNTTLWEVVFAIGYTLYVSAAFLAFMLLAFRLANYVSG